MKRDDFDPNGERNSQNREICGYERLSCDEVLNIVSGKVSRQKKTYGLCSITSSHGFQKQWRNIGQ